MGYQDLLIVIFFKLLLMVGFFYGIKYWIKKSRSVKWPLIIYGLFGVWFILYLSFDIFSWTLATYANMKDPNNAYSIGVILSIVFYIYLFRVLKKERPGRITAKPN